ncbi:MAG: hypothetical protein LBJ61_03600 [Deltaproteobacteria bacterium]|jgi:hypothetical protein|nr:hypothetical protein [Deltaproteobacteria bacterium]
MNIDDNDKNNLPDDIKLDFDSQLSQDFSLDAPDLEPAPAGEPVTQKSQAVKDLEEMEERQGLGTAGEGEPPKADSSAHEPILSAPKEKVKKTKPAPVVSSAPRGYRWFFVHLLSLVGLVAWAVCSFISSEPYRWEAALIALAVVLLTVPTVRIFHVRTRAGLAGLGAALGLAVCSLYDPNAYLLPGLPMAFVWLIILTIVWVWLVTAIVRNKDLRKNKVALVLPALLLYPLLGPIFAAVDGLFAQAIPISDFSLKYLNESPVFLTSMMPWFFWPMTFMAFLIPPLAAIFLLKDQLSYRKTEPERYHLGALWLSLAGFVVLIYSFFSLAPITEEYPDTVKAVRDLWPAAAQYQETQAAKVAAAERISRPIAKPAPKPAAEPTGPAPETAAEAATEPAPDTVPEAATATEEAPAATPEETTVVASTEGATTEGATTEGATPEPATEPAPESAVEPASDPASEPVAGESAAEPATDPAVATGSEDSPSDGGVSLASVSEPSGSDPAVREVQAEAYPESPTAEAGEAGGEAEPPSGAIGLEGYEDVAEVGPIMPKSLEVGATASRPGQEGLEDSSAIVVVDSEVDDVTAQETLQDQIDSLNEQIDYLNDEKRALNEAITDLRSRNAVLEAQNQILVERLRQNDQIINNLTEPR